MRFESLPNELICDLFEYLDGTDLFRCFYGLNTRFDRLLAKHRQFHLNFQHVAREEFDIIHQKHLSSIVKRVISIEVHDNTETPKFPIVFLQSIFNMYKFVQLKSLTIYSVHSLDLLIQIFRKRRSFSYLTHLNIVGRVFSNNSQNISALQKCIWKLPRLTDCNLSGIRGLQANQLKDATISLSIQNLSIADYDLNIFFYILYCTPNLRRLYVTNQRVAEYRPGVRIISSLTSLRMSFCRPEGLLIHIFQSLPHLQCLTLEIAGIIWNGQRWKQILDENLPNLRKLRFKMENSILSEYQSVDILLQSFQTSFWLVEHRWYVGCYWDPHNMYRIGIVYTLPYAFENLDINNEWSFKTTALDENHHFQCDRASNLTYSGEKNLVHQVPFYCPNIRKLYIDHPYDFGSFSWFSSLNRLKSLCIPIRLGFDYNRFQLILNQLPHLYTLTLDIQDALCEDLFQLTSPSVRQIDLPLFHYSPCFSIENCSSLISSPLGRQCEVLSIRIDQPMSILQLIQYIPNLRTLSYQWKSTIRSYREFNIQLEDILEKYFPSVCSFNECSKDSSQIDIWINRQIKQTILSSTI